MNIASNFVASLVFLLFTCLILWALGRLIYADGVVYFVRHTHTDDSIAPTTSGLGVRLPIFILVSLIFVVGSGFLALFVRSQS